MVSFDHNSYPGAPVTQYTGGAFDLLAVRTQSRPWHPKERHRLVLASRSAETH